ncbi:MAG: efflux RND transporter periplasmic adaptor subunit [candidate division WOR-3 bacterium]
MKKFFVILSIIVVLIVFVIFSKTRNRPIKSEEFVRTVSFSLAKNEEIKIYQDFYGKIEGYKQTEVFSDVPGRFLEYKVSEGEYVRKDQIIAEIDRSIPGVSFEKAKVISPIDGRVYDLSINKGDFVTNQTPVCMIVDDASKIAKVSVSSELLEKIKNGTFAQVEVDEKKFNGKVIRVSKYPNNYTNLGSIDVLFTGDGNLINKGCTVKILLEKKNDVLTVPFESVKNDQNGEYVFVLKNGIAIKVDVKTGLKNESQVEIVSGLDMGDTIVTIGSDMLKDGQKVKVR